MMMMSTNSTGMDILLNFSIPLLTPRATIPQDRARNMVLKARAVQPDGENSPKSREKLLRKYSIDHPPTML